ncbi:MAG: TRAP transporter substrate-binding protein [Termitinemataceae bacterium]|nr:MAG: TRAP transporter substrate-binding protein [Termitinemataceae bacterium]
MSFAEGMMQADGSATLKLASLAPEQTPWGAALNKLAKDWSSISGGQINVQVYHNGVAGNEPDVIRKLKQNQIQAAVLTSVGLNEISPDIMTVSTPFLIRTEAELTAVLNELNKEMNDKLIAQGFYPIAWNRAGWLRFFARSPIKTPADLKKQKLGGPQSPAAFTNTFKSMGYQITPVGMNDTIMSLNSGAIDVVFNSPIAAAPTQVFGIAKHMSDFKIAPFVGAIVMNKPCWDNLPEKYKAKLLDNAASIGPTLDPKIVSLEDTAVKTMQDHGLNVVRTNQSDLDQWIADVDKAMPQLFSTKTFDADLHKKIQVILQKMRNK